MNMCIQSDTDEVQKFSAVVWLFDYLIIIIIIIITTTTTTIIIIIYIERENRCLGLPWLTNYVMYYKAV